MLDTSMKAHCDTWAITIMNILRTISAASMRSNNVQYRPLLASGTSSHSFGHTNECCQMRKPHKPHVTSYWVFAERSARGAASNRVES